MFEKMRTFLDKLLKMETSIANDNDYDLLLRLSRVYRFTRDHNPDLIIYSKFARQAASELIKFLKDAKNIQKLKKCPVCNGFFIAAAHNQKYCHPWCKRQVHQPPGKSRVNVRKWRAARKQKRMNIVKESRIKRMITGGFTREEALEILAEEEV